MKKKLTALLLCGLFLTGCGGNTIIDDKPDEEENLPYEITQVSPKLWEDNIYTVAQSSGFYQDNIALPSDAMMAFGIGYLEIEGQIQNWLASEAYKQINLFIPIGRDHNSYYLDGKFDGETHYDLIQKRADGTLLSHPTGKTYYIHPSEGYARFMAAYAKKAIQAGVTDLYIEEPDGFSNAAYSDFMKAQWQQYYGSAWQDPSLSADNRYKSDMLMAHIFTRAFEVFSREVKSVYPDTKIYVCTHSSVSYAANPISANNFDIVNLEGVDGIIAQAWTDTSIRSVSYDGQRISLPFEYSYAEYSELYSTVRENGKKYYSLSDPAADGGYSLEFTRNVYQQNVVAQLLQPEINSYQISIWPDRSFAPASTEYQSVQQAVFTAMNEVSKLPAKRTSGTTGVGVLMSYNSVSNGNSNQIADYVMGLTLPLLQEGIPLDVLLLESLTQNSLNNYKVLLLSYNYIKPENAEQNEILAKFVKAGGTLIYVGGEGNNNSLTGFWSQEGYSTPQEHLFAQMGMSVHQIYSKEKLSVKKTAHSPEYFQNFANDSTSGIAVTQENSSSTTYLKQGDSSLLLGMQYDGGNVLFLGVDPCSILSNDNMRALLKSTVRLGVELKGETYKNPKYIMTERGDFLAIKTYDAEITLSGTYVNIFSDDMQVLKNPTVSKNSYALYKKLTEDGNPKVFMANSRDVVSSFTNNTLTFTTKTISGSRNTVLVHLPDYELQTVLVKDSVMGSSVSFTQSYDEQTEMLKLMYTQVSNAPIEVQIKLK